MEDEEGPQNAYITTLTPPPHRRSEADMRAELGKLQQHPPIIKKEMAIIVGSTGSKMCIKNFTLFSEEVRSSSR